jgi:hypothetical protein
MFRVISLWRYELRELGNKALYSIQCPSFLIHSDAVVRLNGYINTVASAAIALVMKAVAKISIAEIITAKISGDNCS